MDEFVEAVAELQRLAVEEAGIERDPDLLGPRCLEEARLVAPCMDRFVYGELDPTRELTVARTINIGPVGTPPSLAEKLGKKLEQADADVKAGAGRAVHKACGIGWLMMQRGGARLESARGTQERAPALPRAREYPL